MAEDWREDAARRARAGLIDTTVPNAARAVDYLHGGWNNFEADRRAVRAMLATAPVIRTVVPAAHAFRGRVLRYLVASAGVRQFIEVGSRLAVSGKSYDVAQSIDPRCRVVYVDDDPAVLTHARALMRSPSEGPTGYLEADVGDPAAILAGARSTLDFGRPVAFLLLAKLANVADTTAAAAVVSSLLAPLVAGSYVAVSHQGADLDPAFDAAIGRWNQVSGETITTRSRSQVASLVAGLEPVPPGLVSIGEWRAEPDDPGFGDVVPVYGVVARKP